MLDQAFTTETLTPIEQLDAILDEVQQCRHKLGAIAEWMRYFGLLAIIGLLLGVGRIICNAVMPAG